MAEFELNEDPQSTWGQSEEYKQAWHEKYGNVSPKAGASKAEWVEFATRNGMSQTDAENATRDDLIERFGAETLQSGASAPNSPVGSPQGTGEGPEGNLPNDPAKRTATTRTGTGSTGGTTA